MILGSIHVAGGAVHTHRDSYLLANLTVVGVRRPLLGAAVVLGAGLAAFGIGFADLLYLEERVGLAMAGGLILLTGWQLGQLKLLSRDLRGSELAGAVFGQYGRLNRHRHEIAAAIREQGAETNS